jgi:hypothetical protein
MRFVFVEKKRYFEYLIVFYKSSRQRQLGFNLLFIAARLKNKIVMPQLTSNLKLRNIDWYISLHTNSEMYFN